MLGFWRGLVGGTDFIIQGYQYPDLFYWHFGLLAVWIYWRCEWMDLEGWMDPLHDTPLVSKSNSRRVLVLSFAFALVIL